MVDMSLKSLLIYGFALHSFFYSRTSLVAQMVKCLSTMWETWVRALGWEAFKSADRKSSWICPLMAEYATQNNPRNLELRFWPGLGPVRGG